MTPISERKAMEASPPALSDRAVPETGLVERVRKELQRGGLYHSAGVITRDISALLDALEAKDALVDRLLAKIAEQATELGAKDTALADAERRATTATLQRDEAMAALREKEERVKALEAEVARVKSDREYVIGFNAGWDEAIAQNLRFPTMLRKMWSGQEVQKWIDDEMARARSVLAPREEEAGR